MADYLPDQASSAELKEQGHSYKNEDQTFYAHDGTTTSVEVAVKSRTLAVQMSNWCFCPGVKKSTDRKVNN